MIKLKNTEVTSVDEINSQMRERRPLPMGRQEFEEWSDRIVSGALVPGAIIEDQKAALAAMIMSLGPTESHKEDAFFIHCLRMAAVKQVAHTYHQEIYFKKHPEKLAEKLASEKAAQERGAL